MDKIEEFAKTVVDESWKQELLMKLLRMSEEIEDTRKKLHEEYPELLGNKVDIGILDD